MPDISKRLEKAEKSLQKGKPEAALEEYLGILDEDPGNNSVRETAADLCLALGRSREAVTLLSSLLESEITASDSVKGIVTYKKLAKVSTPTPLQTFHYAQFVEKRDRKEALEAYEVALKGLEAQDKDKQALIAAQKIVDISPTAANLQRAAEKFALVGDKQTAALYYVQLGYARDNEAPGGGFEAYEKAYNLDRQNLQAALLYASYFYANNSLAECIAVLTPAVADPRSTPELRDLLVRALIGCKQPSSAEPYAWQLFEQDPKRIDEIGSLIGAYLDEGLTGKAMALARRLEQHENKAGRLRDFISQMEELAKKRTPSLEFLEYLVELFNTANREQEYCATLSKLFQLYFAAGKYAKAGEALDRAAEVDPYEPGHGHKLGMLRGKIDPNLYSTIANRFQTSTGSAMEPAAGPSVALDVEPTILEDIILQAEIYLQYGMRSKAVDRLERVRRLFPEEESRNDKLRQLFLNAGMVPKAATAPAAAMAAPPEPIPATAAVAPAVHTESGIDDFTKVTDITRNIHRQASVKGVLFTAVNEIGRHFNASRCVAGLCTLGKPPSAALEYCAPGIAQSDVMAIVKLIAVMQQQAARGPVAITSPRESGQLESMREHITALNIQSLLAVPLMDAGEQCGILVLEQCTPREWQPAGVMVLKTIAEQLVLAVSNARMRSLMKTLAVTDEKSGLLKRSSYLDVLLSEVRRSLQQRTPQSVMLLHFGKASALSREIGEPQVDGMMQHIGQTICTHIRQNDVAVRYDLTTIALLLSDTNEKNALLVVDKMRKVLVSLRIPGTDRPPILSIGIAETALQPTFDPVDIVTEVINRAEAALEVARTDGGNKAQALAPRLEANAVG
ncbi:MAG TPA: diguanylate cyclase [Candidatus Angelobacter sp.]|nr:diguanylate cyclase [Candidatus Angelobacter sp.]